MDTLLGGESYVRNSARKQTNKKLPDSRKKKKNRKNTRGKLDLCWNVVAPFWWSRNGLFLLLCDKIPSLKWHSLGIDLEKTRLFRLLFLSAEKILFLFSDHFARALTYCVRQRCKFPLRESAMIWLRQRQHERHVTVNGCLTFLSRAETLLLMVSQSLGSPGRSCRVFMMKLLQRIIIPKQEHNWVIPRGGYRSCCQRPWPSQFPREERIPPRFDWILTGTILVNSKTKEREKLDERWKQKMRGSKTCNHPYTFATLYLTLCLQM